MDVRKYEQSDHYTTILTIDTTNYIFPSSSSRGRTIVSFFVVFLVASNFGCR